MQAFGSIWISLSTTDSPRTPRIGVRTQGKSWTPGVSSQVTLEVTPATVVTETIFCLVPWHLLPAVVVIQPSQLKPNQRLCNNSYLRGLGQRHIIYLVPKWPEFKPECAIVWHYENYLISLDLDLLWSIHWRRWFILITTQLYYTG